MLALLAALLPRPNEDTEGPVESNRRRRNLDITSLIGAATAFTGAALVAAAWPWSLVAFFGAALVYYLALVLATHREDVELLKEVQIARDVDRRPDGRPGRVWVRTAVWLGVAPDEWLSASVPFYGDPVDESYYTYADGLQKIAEERARWRSALRRPMGSGQTPLDILRARLLWRQIRRQEREQAQMVHTPVHTPPPEHPD